MSSLYLQNINFQQDNINLRCNSVNTMDLLVGNSINVATASVTQGTSVSAPVTIDSEAGTIVTFTSTAAGSSTTNFSVVCPQVLVTDQIIISVNGYTGIFGTNGFPVVVAHVSAPGGFGVSIFNAHPSNAFSGVFTLRYQVIHSSS